MEDKKKRKRTRKKINTTKKETNVDLKNKDTNKEKEEEKNTSTKTKATSTTNKKKKKKKKKKIKFKYKNIIKLIVSIIMLILSIICFAYVNNLNVLPFKYLLLFVSVLLILNFISTILLLSKSKIKHAISIILYIIIVLISIIGIKYVGNTIKYLNEGFNNNKVELTTYNIIVLNDSSYETIEDLNNTTMGYLFLELANTDYLNTVKSKVNTELKQLDVFELYKELMNQNIASIVINDGYISLIEEEYPDFSEKTKTLDTIDVEVKKETNNKKLNELKPINIYLSGTDSRSSNISSNGTSDVNIVVTINPATHTILLTNIPRDYYVQLHGTTGTKDKLTHAGFYGLDMSRQTIEDLMGIEIDYSVKVGFNSVIKLVDLVGGIDIYSDITYRTHCKDGGAKSVYIQKGWNHLTGAQALSFARERYAYTDGDRQRGRNQQEVIKAIFNKIISDKSILLKYDSLLNSFSSLYRTDIPKEFVTLLIKEQLNNMTSWTIESQSVDGYGASGKTYSMPGYDNLYVMIPYQETINKATNKINSVLNIENN